MKHQSEQERVTRRNFLRTAGLTVGTLAAPSMLSSVTSPVSAAAVTKLATVQRNQLRIGVVLPRSSMYPQMGANLLAGLQLFFKQAQSSLKGRSVELVVRHTNGSIRAEQAVEQLLQARAQLIVGMFNPFVASTVRSQLADSQTCAVVVNMGENVPRPENHHEWIFHNSLSYWQSAWAMGVWAARHMGSRAVMASSFYDSGYDSLYAFQHGFESAGGTVMASLVTHLPQNAESLPQAIAAIKETAPDFVYGAYCGQPALDFVRAYAEAGLAGRVPLAGSAHMVDEQLLPIHGAAAVGIKSCLSWAVGLNTDHNRRFSASYHHTTGCAPDTFALLGFETARFVAEAMQAVGNSHQPGQLQAALAGVRFNSPRGSWDMQHASHTPTTPLYLREVQRQAGAASNVVLAELGAALDHPAQLAALQTGPKTGWVNPYLCV